MFGEYGAVVPFEVEYNGQSIKHLNADLEVSNTTYESRCCSESIVWNTCS